jgi:hypothetical protein
VVAALNAANSRPSRGDVVAALNAANSRPSRDLA